MRLPAGTLGQLAAHDLPGDHPPVGLVQVTRLDQPGHAISRRRSTRSATTPALVSSSNHGGPCTVVDGTRNPPANATTPASCPTPAARPWYDPSQMQGDTGLLTAVSNIREDAPAGLDTTTPNVARIYDYLLGGKDNFAADRAAAGPLLAVIPDVAAIAADNRAFLGRAVRYLTGQGIRQFLDLGSGLPTRSNVHEVARQHAPGTRAVYVDYDPVVALHGKALRRPAATSPCSHADLAEPSSILEHPDLLRVLDLSLPVGLICASALHFVPDEADPWGIIARYRDRLCPGSYLAITHAPARVPGEDPDHDEENAAEVFRQTSAPLHMRTLAEIQRFFDGFELVPPGVVFMQDWHPDPGGSRRWPVPVIPGGSRPQAAGRPARLPLRLSWISK